MATHAWGIWQTTRCPSRSGTRRIARLSCLGLSLRSQISTESARMAPMGVAMNTDLLTLLDQMEEAIASAPALPVGGRIVVNRDQLLDFIDAIRGEMPETVIEAERVSRDRSKIIGDARSEADQLLGRARDQASYLIQEHTVLKSAELEGERVLNRAREEAAQITTGAERYAQELFTRLEEETLRLAADIRKAAGLKP